MRDNPLCLWCGRPCVAGQRDALGSPAHLGCQIAAVIRGVSTAAISGLPIHKTTAGEGSAG
jgi:hypothetical protein